jgi:Dyp-type peroxidase family
MVPFDETKYPASKRLGVASETTILTRIKIGRVEKGYPTYLTYRRQLELVLDGLQTRAKQNLPTPIQLIRQIHFARWIILERPGSAGDLLFTSNFDGDMKHYFRAFALELTGDIDRVWENCEGYPGAKDFDVLWQYVKRHQITTRTFYDAYPSLTMPDIERIDALRKVIGKAASAGERDPGALLQGAQLKRPPIAPRRAGEELEGELKPLDQADIQANLLSMPPWKRADYRFLTIDDPALCRRGLMNLIYAGAEIGLISADRFAQHKAAHRQGRKGLDRSINVAFTAGGLTQLGVAQEYVGGMPLAFQQGMAARAHILGDSGDWAPPQWQGMLGNSNVHIVIAAYGMSHDVESYWRDVVTCVHEDEKVDGTADFLGCRTIHRELGERSEHDGYLVEPFGFRDGIGQPLIEGVDEATSAREIPIAPGEFILGYPDVDGNDQIAEKTVGPSLRQLCLNGTYMVFRKIEQDVAAFNEATCNGDLASRLFGRKKNGRSLVDPTSQEDLDDFNYKHDPDGNYCPFGSHVRRLNPRNEEVRRHRIIRRGIPYKNDDRTQGMLFVCLNARIDSQFEFLQSEWAEKGDFLGSFTDARDPVIGGGALFFDASSRGSPVVLKSFVRVRGGEYLFIPGIGALHSIATNQFVAPADAKSSDDDVPIAAIDPARFSELMFDPVTYIDPNLGQTLLATRSVERKQVAWTSGRQQSLYYVACRDDVRQILGDDIAFPSDQYARKMKALLASYDFKTWLRAGETPPDLENIKKVMLGMTRDDSEKKERLRMLNNALGASSLTELREKITLDVRTIAEAVAAEAIRANPNGFDIVPSLAYALPLEYAVSCLGFPSLEGFSETYQALYFGRDSIQDFKAGGYPELFPKGEDRAKLSPELYLLVHTIALFLLIDQYETESSLVPAQLAIKEFLDRLGKEILEEEGRLAKDPNGTMPPTLLSRLLRQKPAADAVTFRLRVGMIMAELVVGSVDTTAKGVTNVVDCFLSYPQVLRAAQAAILADDDSTLDNLILEALRLSPVAPVIIRECPIAKTIDLSGGPFTFEPESRLFLITQAAMIDPVGAPADLQTFVMNDTPPVLAAIEPIRRLAFGDGAHGCLGSETVLAEIRSALKPLLIQRNFRRAAGPKGQMQESSSLPVSLEVRFEA